MEQVPENLCVKPAREMSVLQKTERDAVCNVSLYVLQKAVDYFL